MPEYLFYTRSIGDLALFEKSTHKSKICLEFLKEEPTLLPAGITHEHMRISRDVHEFHLYVREMI